MNTSQDLYFHYAGVPLEDDVMLNEALPNLATIVASGQFDIALDILYTYSATTSCFHLLLFSNKSRQYLALL